LYSLGDQVKELESDLEHKEYELSIIYYDMYYGDEDSEEELKELEEYEDSEEDPEVLEIEIE